MSNPNPNRDNLKSFKPTWKHTPTRTIRVPVELADNILDYARDLDAGATSDSPDTSEIERYLTEIENLSGKGALNKAKALASKCKELLGD